MYDKRLIIELLIQVNEAIQRVERRFRGIKSPDDFVKSEDGGDRLDAIAMMLIAIGENIKSIDKVSGKTILQKYPEIHWPGVKGVRDILAHDYFNIDPEEIFAICAKDLAPLKAVIEAIRKELQ
jgi:uncharacterized protein with HEPN domain